MKQRRERTIDKIYKMKTGSQKRRQKLAKLINILKDQDKVNEIKIK